MSENGSVAPFKALLVEGTSGVGKSTLIDALLRRHMSSVAPRKVRSLTHLAQSHTYGPLAVVEDAGLTVEQNLQHLDRIVSHMEWLHTSVQEHARPWCFVILDTLHLTHCVRPGVVSWEDVAPIDRRLATIGCKVLMLRASAQTIWDRGILPRRNEQFLLEYAKKFGRNHHEIHEYFVREQERIADSFSKSRMPTLPLSSDDALDATLDAAFRFWMDD